ncbi:MAG: hypothetical protein ABR976_20925 [Terracidiphilus sp.]
MLRVMDLPGWPPNPGGAKSEGERSPTALDQVTIEQVNHVMEDHVMFTCRFNGHQVPHNFQLADKKTGEKIEKILNDNRGKTLLSIGIIEIPPN